MHNVYLKFSLTEKRQHNGSLLEDAVKFNRDFGQTKLPILQGDFQACI